MPFDGVVWVLFSAICDLWHVGGRCNCGPTDNILTTYHVISDTPWDFLQPPVKERNLRTVSIQDKYASYYTRNILVVTSFYLRNKQFFDRVGAPPLSKTVGRARPPKHLVRVQKIDMSPSAVKCRINELWM